MNNLISDLQKEKLINTFGEYLIENAPLAKFSSARLGGYADFMLTAHSAFYLEKMVPEPKTTQVMLQEGV